MIYNLIQSLNPFRRASVVREWAHLSQVFLPNIALVTQKTTVEYCRVKAGSNRRELFSEEFFQESLTVSLKTAWPLVMDDFILALGLYLAAHAPTAPQEALTKALLALREEIAASAPEIVQPLNVSPDFTARLTETLTARPSINNLGGETGASIYAVLPLHKQLIRYDREVVVNNVRLTFLSSWLALAKRLDAAELMAALPGSSALK